MLDLFAELADRRVTGGSDDGHLHPHWHLPCTRAPRRPEVAGVPAPERPPHSTAAWPGEAPEAVLGLWTELAWRHCHAARGRE
jgi:hypothetical protein